MSISTIEDKKKTCRFCGYQDTRTYCSKCGLNLEHSVSTPLSYIQARYSSVHEITLRFIRTFFILLIKPGQFFLALNNPSKGASIVSLVGNKEPAFRVWRRPTTPEGYLLIIILIIAIFSKYNNSASDFFQNFIETLIRQDLLSTSELFIKLNITSIIFNISLLIIEIGKTDYFSLVIEIVIVFYIFTITKPYQLLLGLAKKEAAIFIEYFQYMFLQSILCYIILFSGWNLLNAYFILSDLQSFLIFLIFFITPSIYYFLITPALNLPKICDVSYGRIAIVYFVMLVILITSPVSLPLFYGVFFLWRAILRLLKRGNTQIV